MARARRWPGLEPGHSFTDADLAGLPGAGYFRVSSNPDETETKSVDDQETEYWPWVKRTGIICSDPDDVYKDDDRSASMFATRQRENFTRLRAAIRAGRYKVVWFWSTSRQTRGDVNIYDLAKVSAEAGALWCVNGQLLNPANEDDLLFLGIHHLMDRQYSWRISKDVRRGQKSNAYAGKPAGRITYGYKRLYDYEARDRRGKPRFIRDVPNVFDGNGLPVEDSPAYVVRQIYDWIAEGKPIGRIARTLEERRIPTPQPPRREGRSPYLWTSHPVLYIARNPFYIGKRVFQAESWRVKDRHAAIIELPDGVEPQWEPLVTEEQWWAVQRILSDPSRLKYRPGKGGSLLAGATRCGECGSTLHVHNDHARGIVPYYVCTLRNHVGIRVDWLDAYVEDRVVSWAADPDVRAGLYGRQDGDSAVAAAARADIDRLEIALEEARAAGEDPDADAVFWDRRARALTAKLAEARELAYPASLSHGLQQLLGPDAAGVADNWWRLRTQNLPAAKRLIREIADIRVHRGVRGGDRYHARIDPGRISWAWLTGPGDHGRVFGEPIPRPMYRIAEALRADPWQSDRGISARLQCADGNVGQMRRKLEDAGEIPVIRRRGRGKPASHGYRPVSPGPS
jgi:DNA invertase Pin-like site-specific DNA recombinase